MEHTFAVLSKAKTIVIVTEKEKLRAAEFANLGLNPLDALHLALAEAGLAEYFCTCDDKLLRNAKRIQDLATKIISPVDLVQELENANRD